MKQNKNLPHLFNEVLDSIAILKESKGSSEKSILNQVDTILHLRRQHLKKSIASIHRALRHGLKTGLLKLKNGKYCLGMSQADYNIYRKVQKLRSTDNLYKEFRSRRGKRRSRRGKRRRRGRRRTLSNEVDDNETEDDDITSNQSSAESAEPVYRTGRRRGRRGRRGGRRKSRRRRGRRRAEEINEKTDESPDQVRQDPSIISPKTSNDSIKTNDQNKEDQEDNKNSSDNQKSDNNDANESDHSNLPHSTDPEKKCDKPDCLCNFKKNYDRKSYD